MEPVIDLEGLGVRIGDAPILRNLDMRVMPGEIVGLHGANGSGKTTLLRVLATLLAPSAGTGFVLGADLTDETRFSVRRRIGLIGHIPALFPELSLEENTAFVVRIAGLDPERVSEVLDAVGLAGARKRRAIQCSHGMQRRAEFARMLLLEPHLVLLDEAHAGLDPQAADLVTMIVKGVRSRDGAAVLVSHERERIRSLIDSSYELGDGRVWPSEEG